MSVKIVIEFKETPEGNVEFSMDSTGIKGASRKEACYAVNIRDLVARELPHHYARALWGFRDDYNPHPSPEQN